MEKVTSLTIKSDYIQKYKDGYPLVLRESIVDLSELELEGCVVDLVDAKAKFIAKGYYGKQNKGYGWILSSTKSEAIDTSFFASKIKTAIEYRKDFFDDASTNTFRVFNGEGDGVGGLTIDYYDAYYVLTWYSLGIYAFKEMILEALKLSVDYKGVYQKKRFEAKGKYLDDSEDFFVW
ncbi:MAG: hypothetical protein Q9M43_13150 [Sulfurimonas sp.]|nr:hypothetical protein [Sulfurimonas sp.]